ncbi:MAG: MFS transporter [Myxococcota bacterium]|nr:MFS transporter [Myxococcota bacterium]
MVVALLTLLFMSELEMTIVSTAMPTITGDIGGIESYSWVFTAYLLTSTVTLMIYGNLADRFGRKPVVFVGVGLFLAGSVACGQATSIGFLIGARALQGLGAGALRSTATTIVGDIYTPEERLKMMGVFSSAVAMAALAGPLVGALIIEVTSWRWIFYVNVPVGLVAVGMLARGLHEDFEKKARRFDFAGALLFSSSVACFLVGMYQRASALVIGASLLGALFLLVEWRTPHPLIPLELFKKRVIAVATIGNALVGAAMLATMTFIPLFVQGVLGRSVLSAGLAFAPMILAMPFASAVAGRVLVPRFGYRMIIRLGATISFAGAVALALVVDRSMGDALTPCTIAIGIGNGFCLTSLMVVVQQSVAWNQRAVATASVLFFRTIGSGIAVGVLGRMLVGESGASGTIHEGLALDFAIVSGMFGAALVATLWLPPLPYTARGSTPATAPR